MRGGILKKGQLQIQETAVVIFIVTVIIAIGLIVFYRYTVNDIRADNAQYLDEKAKGLIEVLPNLPELKVSELGIEADWCIDKKKALVFDTGYYDFGRKRLKIDEITLYDSLDAGQNTRKFSSPVCLYDPVNERKTMAKLAVEW